MKRINLFTTEDAEDTEETQENQPGELFSSASSVSSAVNRGEDAEFAKLTVERDSLQSDLAKAAEECNTLRFNLQKAEDALRQVNERLAKLLSEPKAPKAIAKTVAISKDDDAAGALLPVKPEGLELLKAIHRGEI